jgi:hypothetical protein
VGDSRFPTGQIISHMLGEQNVTGITAIHHSLSDVDPGSGNIGLFVQISNLVNWAAVNAHPHLQFGMTFELPANLNGAEDRGFGAGAENERAAVTRR